MSEEYSAVLTGGLSLKGGLFKSKKKKKGKRKREEAEAAARAQEAAVEEAPSSGETDVAGAGTSGSDGDRKKDGMEGTDKEAVEEENDVLTPAQRRFREKQLEREGKKIRGMVKQTHRERIENFNALLASMTEHNDIPRCSAAGNG